jgi:hypothetical protein
MMKPDNFWWKVIHLNPVLFRTAVVAVFVLAGTLGFHFLAAEAVADAATTLFVSVGALVAALWSRDGVVPMAKVVAYQPDPVDAPSQLEAGPATAPSNSDAAVLRAARTEGTE